MRVSLVTPTRGVYTITPHRDPHPTAPLLLDPLATAFAPAGPTDS